MSFENNPFQRNMELWQQFGETYTKNMFTMFEQYMAQSKAFQEQVQTAVNQAVDAQFEMVSASLKAMEEQIDELTKTMNEAAQPQTNGKAKK